MFYLDWRPVVVEASVPKLLKAGTFRFKDDEDRKLMLETCKKHLSTSPYLPVFLTNNFNRIDYAIRTDGIFAFGFDRTAVMADDHSDFQLAQVASYFLKVFFGHTHKFDAYPINISKRLQVKTYEYQLATNWPVQFGAAERKKARVRLETGNKISSQLYLNNLASLKKLVANDKLGLILACADEGQKTPELAVLKIKRQFAAMYDLTEASVRDVQAQRERISIFMIIMALVCGLYIANIFGLSVDVAGGEADAQGRAVPDDDSDPGSTLIYLPITFFFGIFAIATGIGAVLKFTKLHQSIREWFMDLISERVFFEFYLKVRDKFGKNFSRLVFNTGMLNKIVLLTTVSLLTTRFLDQSIAFIFPLIGFPVYEISEQVWQLNQEQILSERGIRFLSFGGMFLLTAHYIPKMMRYRKFKLKAWKRCMGYMTVGSTYLRVVHKIVSQIDAPHSHGFYSAIKLSEFHLNNERNRMLADWVSYIVLLTIPLYGILSTY